MVARSESIPAGVIVSRSAAGIELDTGRTGNARGPHMQAVELLHPLVARDVIFVRHKAPGQTARYVLEATVNERRPPPTLKRGVKIADPMELIIDPAKVYFVVIFSQDL